MSIKMYGKIQWYIITSKRRFLQSLKYGRYYFYRLRARKKRLLKNFEIKN